MIERLQKSFESGAKHCKSTLRPQSVFFFSPLVVFAEAELFNDDARASELASP